MKKQILTRTLRVNSRAASLLLCIIALLTCVSVTFAWFGSTFENLNTVITMGDYSAEISIYDADGSKVESKSASNGESVSFDNTQKMSGWSSGNVHAYYIYAQNTGDIDIKTYLSFDSEFVSNAGSDYSENKKHFAFVVKDITEKCEQANGFMPFIENNQLPTAEYIYQNGTTFDKASSTLAGTVKSGESGAYALYYCCYDLPNEFVSSSYNFILNTSVITAQAGMPENQAVVNNGGIEDAFVESLLATNPTQQSTTQQPTTQGTTVEQNPTEPETVNEWVWSFNDSEEKTITLTEYNGSETELTIPSIVDGYRVTKLGNNLFANSSVEKVTVPAGITSFGIETFNITSLEKLEFQARTAVEDEVYTSPYKVSGNAIYTADMSTLVRYLPQAEDTEFAVPASVSVIYDYAFTGCNNLEAVAVKNVNTFGSDTFSGCSIKDIKLFNNSVVVASGTDVFGSKSDVTIHVLSSMKNAYKSAVAVSGYIVEADLEKDIYSNYPRTEINGLKYLILKSGDSYNGTTYKLKGHNEFVIINGCSSVPEDGTVVIPETIICDDKVYPVAAIADGAFNGCKELKILVLPNHKVAYTSKAFEGCDNLGVIQNNDVVKYVPAIKETAAVNSQTESDESDKGDTEPTE